MNTRLLLLSLLVPGLVMCVKPDNPEDPDNPETDIYAEAPAELVDGSTILVTNELIEDFMTNVKYSAKDYSSTAIKDRNYKDNMVSPGNYDAQPQYSIRWKESDVAAGEDITVTVTEAGTGKQFKFTPVDSETYYAVIYNFLPGAAYTYSVSTDTGKIIKEGSFSTKGSLHHMTFMARVRNVRDLGGWKAKDNKTVKYRMVYRGGRLESSTLTGLGARQVKAEGIKAQLDLRGQSDVLSAPADPSLDFCAPVIEEGYTQFLKDDKLKMKQCFEYVVECVRDDKPVYYHCSLGRDRTGTLTMVLLGVLGVDEGDISKEYELTQFAPYGYSVSSGEKTQMTRLVDYKSAATYIWTNYAKEGTFAQGVEAYLLDIGVAQKDIDDFRKIMLE